MSVITFIMFFSTIMNKSIVARALKIIESVGLDNLKVYETLGINYQNL